MQARQPQTIQELRRLLRNIGTFEPHVLITAQRDLLTAVDNYLLTRPVIDSSGVNRPLPIADARGALTELARHLRRAQAIASCLPPIALNAFDEMCNPPAGMLTLPLTSLIDAVGRAQATLLKEVDRPVDAARAYLALEVARVLSDTLQMRPARTRLNKFTGTSKPGTAAYARLLEATFAVAGLPSADLGRWMEKGLTLLNDPELPQ